MRLFFYRLAFIYVSVISLIYIHESTKQLEVDRYTIKYLKKIVNDSKMENNFLMVSFLEEKIKTERTNLDFQRYKKKQIEVLLRTSMDKSYYKDLKLKYSKIKFRIDKHKRAITGYEKFLKAMGNGSNKTSK